MTVLEDMEREHRAMAEQASRMASVVTAVRRLIADLDDIGVTLAVERTATMVEVSIGVESKVEDRHPEIPKVDGGRPYQPAKPETRTGRMTPPPDPNVVCVNKDAEAIRGRPAGAAVPPALSPPSEEPSARDGGAGGQANQPSADQMPAPAVAINVHSPDAARPTAVHIPNAWTAVEIETVRRIVSEGGTQTDVFKALGGSRTKSACKTMCIRLRKEIAATRSAESEAEPTPPCTDGGPGEPVEQNAEDGSEEAASATAEVERVAWDGPKAPELGASLGGFDLPGLRDDWTRDLDYDLALSLTTGTKLRAWATANNVDLDDARRRSREIWGEIPSYDTQLRACRALREAVEPVAEAAE